MPLEEKNLTSVDVSYGYRLPANGIKEPVAALVQELPFRDESFDATVSFFTFQHIQGEDQGKAVREAIRVTKTADYDYDLSKGIIIINPVFRPYEATEGLAKMDWTTGLVGILNDHGRIENSDLALRRLTRDSLVIHKTPELTDEKIDEVISFLVKSKVLSPHLRSIGEVATRRFQKLNRILKGSPI